MKMASSPPPSPHPHCPLDLPPPPPPPPPPPSVILSPPPVILSLCKYGMFENLPPPPDHPSHLRKYGILENLLPPPPHRCLYCLLNLPLPPRDLPSPPVILSLRKNDIFENFKGVDHKDEIDSTLHAALYTPAPLPPSAIASGRFEYHLSPSSTITSSRAENYFFPPLAVDFSRAGDRAVYYFSPPPAIASSRARDRAEDYFLRPPAIASSTAEDHFPKNFDGTDNRDKIARKLLAAYENIRQNSSSSSSSSAIPSHKKHGVFLSFRGLDNRDKFSSKLLAALHDENITTFSIDHDSTDQGHHLLCPISEAIQESMLSVIIFSENYASSADCLADLAHILECKEKARHAVLPIFYDTRKQQGSYATAFSILEERFNHKMDEVRQWRNALTHAGCLSESDAELFRPEFKLIKEIVKDIQRILNRTLPRADFNFNGLVGIEKRIEEIEKLLCIGSHGIRVVGIWGIGGIGKTTLAEAVYVRLSSQFECCYFLENVIEESTKGGLDSLNWFLLTKLFKEKGLGVVKEMQASKKVLLVLDGVEDLDQFRVQAREQYKFFSAGSRIIVTTRDARLLRDISADGVYKVEELNYDEALQLFLLNAFGDNYPTTDYLEMSERIVEYSKGLPLAIKTFGSSLCFKGKDAWEKVTNLLKVPEEVHLVLKKSYDGLDDMEKEAFLDIACFLKGECRELVEQLLGSGTSYTQVILDHLIDMSLITINHDKQLWMHDLVQEMGREIARQQTTEAGNRIRLWNFEDAYHVLQANTGTAAIEGISLETSGINHEIELFPRVFQEMHNLRLLKINAYDDNTKKWNTHLPQGLRYLPGSLKYLHWDGYPLKCLPLNVTPQNLVGLIITNSRIVQLWEGFKHLTGLKLLDLSHSKQLIQIPELYYQAPNLECILLLYCTSLAQIPSSLPFLDKLKILNLRGCSSIQEFPMLPMNIRNLDLSLTSIKRVPSSSIRYLPYLKTLYLENCKRLETLPTSLSKLKSLEHINLFGCSELEDFPVITERMETLKDVKLDRTGIKELHRSIGNLIGLERLSLEMCENLEFLPESISRLNSLIELNICCCPKLKYLPELPSYLETLNAKGCTSLETVSYSRISLAQGQDDYFFQHSSGRFDFINCLNLDQNSRTNIMANAQHRLLTMAISYPKDKERQICGTWCPGDKIPEWFNYQSKGSSMQIKLPRNWCTTNFLGFALGIVVDFKKFHVEENSIFNFEFGLGTDSRPHEVAAEILTFNLDDDPEESAHDIIVDFEHMLLFYYFNENCFAAKHDKNVRAASFGFCSVNSSCKVKSCGVRLLYAEDALEEISQVITQDVGTLSDTVDIVTDFADASHGHAPEASGGLDVRGTLTQKEEEYVAKRSQDIAQDVGKSSNLSSDFVDVCCSHEPEVSGYLEVHDTRTEKEEHLEKGFHDIGQDVGKSSEILEEEDRMSPFEDGITEDDPISDSKDGNLNYHLESSGSPDVHDADTKIKEDGDLNPIENHKAESTDSCSCLTFFSLLVDIFKHAIGRLYGSDKVDLHHEERLQAPDKVFHSIMTELGEHNKRISRHLQTVIPTTSNGSFDSRETTSTSIVTPSQFTAAERKLPQTPEEIIDNLCSQINEVRDHNKEILQKLQTLMPTTLANAFVGTFPGLRSPSSASNVNDLFKDMIADEQQVEVPEEVIHTLQSHLMQLRDHNQRILQLLRLHGNA